MVTKYIGIAARNGFGVFTDCNRMENAREYLSKASVKTFDSFWDAFCFARDVYNSFQEEFDNVFFGESRDLTINWILFRNKIREKNIES